MMKENGFVYRWVNKINGKYYVGSHKGTKDDGYVGSGIIFFNAIKKYGIENFEREILYEGNDFRKFEDDYLKEHKCAADLNSYNLKDSAIGGSFYGEANGMWGKHVTDFTKSKISKELSTGERWGDPKKREEHSEKMSGNNPIKPGSKRDVAVIDKIKTTKALRKKEWSFLRTGKHHANIFYHIYKKILKEGIECSPRGERILEIQNFNYIVPPYVRFTNFKDRNFNLLYIKREFLWYLKGDKLDTSIAEYAKIWKNLINDDGSINSNYGQYVFGEQKQFDFIREELFKDRDSRRASIVILNHEHLKQGAKDIPCTYSINFRIRDNKLNMTVRMRSQDAIFGMTNDVACFSFIHEMMYVSLKEKYKELEYGIYYHSADSFHVYERHWEMLKKLVGIHRHSSYSMILCPQISSHQEVNFLRSMHIHQNLEIPDEYKFTRWLLDDLYFHNKILPQSIPKSVTLNNEDFYIKDL